jgi:Icc-related predicted phosphoesterase
MTRLVYTADLHGNLDLYRVAGQAAQRWGADAIIFGGDLCPGTPSAASTHLPHAQPQFLLHELGPVLEQWKRRQPCLRIFAIPGNDDCQTVLPALEELEKRGLIENLHQTAKSLGDYVLAGLAFVPPTPFSIKDFERRDSARDAWVEPQFARCVLGTPRGFKPIEDFVSYLNSLPTLEEELNQLPAGDPARTVAVIHCPPFETACDVLFDGRHIGSRALRRWTENRQPLLALHGHIHESPKVSGAFVDRIGNTIVVNPGCDHSRPHLVFIDLEHLTELEHSIYGKTKLP